MTPKRKSLVAAARGEETSVPTSMDMQTQEEAVNVDTPPKVSKSGKRPGKKHIGGYFSEEVLIQLNVMRAKQGNRTHQAMVAEALNLLFEKYSEPPIA